MSTRSGHTPAALTFLLAISLSPALAPLLLACQSRDDAGGVEAGSWDRYATPEQAGWSSEALAEARAYAEEIGSAAVMLIHDGHVVVAWGDVERRFKVHSMRKSFLSALYGTHVAAGTVDLDATIGELGIDDVEGLADAEREARVVDLLRARSGVYHPAAYEPRSMQDDRPARGSAAPGESWFYNNWDFNTLATIFRRTTELDLFEEFEARIARPTGMEDFSLDDTFYWLEPSKSMHPAYLFRLSARDAARFGQLFLQDGDWNGRQLVPADWIRESTRPQTTFENGEDGYGYMWWYYGRSTEPRSRAQEYDAYAARGSGAQIIMVAPEANVVFVHRGDTDNGDGVGTGSAFRLAGLLLEAWTGEPVAEPTFGPLEVEPFPNAQPAPPMRAAITLTNELVRSVVGEYEIAPELRMRIHELDGRVFAHLTGMVDAELELFPESAESWFSNAGGVHAAVQLGEDGVAETVTVRVSGDTLVARRIEQSPNATRQLPGLSAQGRGDYPSRPSVEESTEGI